jgi:hypothetical protein
MDFMKLAEDYCKDAVTAAEWLQSDDDQHTILALEAKISKLNSYYPHKRDSNACKRNTKDEWAWKNIPPKVGEPKKKKFKGKTYYWCKQHKQWTVHSPSEYCLRQSEDKSLKDKKALKLKVYQAALQTSSEDEGINSEDQDSHSTSLKESIDSNTSAWLFGQSFHQLCRPIFLLLYQIFYLSFILIPGIIPRLSEPCSTSFSMLPLFTWSSLPTTINHASQEQGGKCN